MKILIVEDEPNYADTLEMFVDQLGYELAGHSQVWKKGTQNF